MGIFSPSWLLFVSAVAEGSVGRLSEEIGHDLERLSGRVFCGSDLAPEFVKLVIAIFDLVDWAFEVARIVESLGAHPAWPKAVRLGHEVTQVFILFNELLFCVSNGCSYCKREGNSAVAHLNCGKGWSC